MEEGRSRKRDVGGREATKDLGRGEEDVREVELR